MQRNSRVIRFGVFEMDLAARELRRSGVRVRLQDQPFRVLALLVERPGEIVTREEIKDAIWAEDTFVEFDHGLNTVVQKIRQALGDSATSPRFLETIPRRGYKFVAPVKSTQPTSGPGRDGDQSRRKLVAVVVAVVAALVAGEGLRQWVAGSASSAPQPILKQLTFDAGLAYQPAVSPDGTLLAYASDRAGDGNLDIFVQQLIGGEPLRLTTHEADDLVGCRRVTITTGKPSSLYAV